VVTSKERRKTQMNITMKITACICISSTLFTGCYSSALISSTGDDKDLIYTNKIETVITKDSTECKFDSPPAVVSDTTVRKRFVSIPRANVSDIYTKESSSFVFVDTNDDSTYRFNNRPTISIQSISGEATDYLLHSVVIGDTGGVLVAIPLDNIEKVQLLKFDTGRTIVAVVEAAVFVSLAVVLVVVAEFASSGGLGLSGGR
jgi:hypothetical protein